MDKQTYVVFEDDSPLTNAEGRWTTEDAAAFLISTLDIRRISEIAPNAIEVRYNSMLVGARITVITL